jgi:hypothetical protein
MHDTKERLSLLWIFALLNYLYADVVALFAIVGSPNLADAPHLPPWALLGSAVLMEIPIAMIVDGDLDSRDTDWGTSASRNLRRHSSLRESGTQAPTRSFRHPTGLSATVLRHRTELETLGEGWAYSGAGKKA